MEIIAKSLLDNQILGETLLISKDKLFSNSIAISENKLGALLDIKGKVMGKPFTCKSENFSALNNKTYIITLNSGLVGCTISIKKE